MTDDDRLHLDAFVDDYLRSKGKGDGGSSGNYRTNADRVIQRFISWVEQSRLDEPSFDALEPQTLRRWIREDLVSDDALSARTVNTYYNYVSAYLGWCVREGILGQNPARTHEAEEELPSAEDTRVGQQQSWRREQRLELVRYLDRQADQALDEADQPVEAVKAMRDRALGYVLAYSGVRGAEILSDPNDDRRDGVEWQDFDFDRQVVWVLSKKQERDDRRLTPKPLHPLQQLQRVLDPEPDWPVFFTLHWGRLYDGLRDHLRTVDGWDDDRVESVIDGLDGRGDIFDAYREHGARPPTLRTDGARDLMKDLTESAEVDLEDDEHDYLQLHGARRGVGAVLYQERGAEKAADQLDNSVGVVEDFYSELKASEESEDVGQAFDEHDRGEES